MRATLSRLGNKPKILIERTKMTFYETINNILDCKTKNNNKKGKSCKVKEAENSMNRVKAPCSELNALLCGHPASVWMLDFPHLGNQIGGIH